MTDHESFGRYRIIDEAAPGPLSRYAVNPFFPFLLVMLLGSLGFVAFIANAVALNGPQRVREITICVVAIAVIALARLEVVILLNNGTLPNGSASYVFTLLTALRLAFGYFVFVSQAETHELRKYLRSLQERA